MNRKSIVQLLVFAVLLTFIYFVLLRHPGSNGRRNEAGRTERPKSSNRAEKNEEHGKPPAGPVSCSSEYFSTWTMPTADSCKIERKGELPEPDPRCTPGGANPSITVEVLRDPEWRTRTVRNCESSEAQKHIAYRWYDVAKPRINSEQNQVCELDHLVPLELGGADGLGNIWPQCGPDAVTLNERYFKRKDHVENYLAAEVKSGQMSLETAQRGIAKDWTQYLAAADQWCAASKRC